MSWEITNNVANVAAIVTGIVSLSAAFVRGKMRSARLERARKILTESQNFLLSLDRQDIVLIESQRPDFFIEMQRNLEEYVPLTLNLTCDLTRTNGTHRAERNYGEVKSHADLQPGLVEELNYWSEVSQKISVLLDSLTSMRDGIAVCGIAHYLVYSQFDRLFRRRHSNIALVEACCHNIVTLDLNIILLFIDCDGKGPILQFLAGRSRLLHHLWRHNLYRKVLCRVEKLTVMVGPTI